MRKLTLLLLLLMIVPLTWAGTTSTYENGRLRFFDSVTGETIQVIAPLFQNFEMVAPVTTNASEVVDDVSLAFTVVSSGTSATFATVAGEHGVATWTASSASTTNSEMVSELIFKATNFCGAEARIKFGTTGGAFNFGFTDTRTETLLPFVYSGTTLSSVATDAAMFLYDEAATTNNLYVAAVDTDVEGTVTSTGLAVETAQWHILRVELNESGYADFWLDGNHVFQDTVGVTPSTALCLYMGQLRTASVAGLNTLTIDYIRFWSNRLTRY